MSVLNQCGEEQVECPLCMEALEVDDLNFFPCTCGYQICRFCWHRIRTDENGLCPACRKAYSENPADFIPLTQEQVAKLKAEKRQREQQRKAKLTENRKHLANVRVVQKNLVFVVGLPPRLADPEVLKKHEYFGKFGKIHKVVINQSTAYAGSQGPSASAYVTYVKSDDALRAIQNVNNITLDGRVIKSSLGTTKYCSHFMKNQSCPKPDCMYLHDFGDPKASFTKEQMHAGKHQEYEKKLHDSLMRSVQNNLTQQGSDSKQSSKNNKDINNSHKCPNNTTTTSSSTTTNKENWPQLSPEKTDKNEKKTDSIKEKSQRNKSKVKGSSDSKRHEKIKTIETHNGNNCNSGSSSSINSSSSSVGANKTVSDLCSIENKIIKTIEDQSCTNQDDCDKNIKSESGICRLSATIDDNSSFFTQNNFQKVQTMGKEEDKNEDLILDNDLGSSQILNDTFPSINSTEDWEAAFGFNKDTCQDEYSIKQGSDDKETLSIFGKNYNDYTSLDNAFQNRFNSSNKLLGDNFMNTLTNKQHTTGSTTNGFVQNSTFSSVNDRLHSMDLGNHLSNGYNNGSLNDLDHSMSKFFADLYKNGHNKDILSMNTNSLNSNNHNGFNQLTNGYLNNLVDKQNFLLHQQRQIEEQLMNLNIKQQTYNQQLLQQHTNNGFRNTPLFNNVNEQNYNGMHNQVYQAALNKNVKSRLEDELDFDPFHETEKGFAELLDNETERRGNCQAVGGSQYNSLGHSHVPPPPPGFVQSSTAHMNSFGSKILPYLNMGNSQHQQQQHQQQQQQTQQINGVAPNNWSNVFPHGHQQKVSQGLCNDWKMLDPAIVSSSRNYMLTNTQQTCDFNNVPQPLLTQHLHGSSSAANRSLDFQNFSNFTLQPQLQNNYSNYSHTQQSFNWLGNELNSQIATPPGFRASNQTTKQQEC